MLLGLEDRISKTPEGLLIEKGENKLDYARVQPKSARRGLIYGAVFTGGVITGYILHQLAKSYVVNQHMRDFSLIGPL